jgi:hypothetical protein
MGDRALSVRTDSATPWMMLTNVNSMLTTSPSNCRRVDLWAFRSALCCGECITTEFPRANSADKARFLDSNSRGREGEENNAAGVV